MMFPFNQRLVICYWNNVPKNVQSILLFNSIWFSLRRSWYQRRYSTCYQSTNWIFRFTRARSPTLTRLRTGKIRKQLSKPVYPWITRKMMWHLFRHDLWSIKCCKFCRFQGTILNDTCLLTPVLLDKAPYPVTLSQLNANSLHCQ